jgi:hypothetical protein
MGRKIFERPFDAPSAIRVLLFVGEFWVKSYGKSGVQSILYKTVI